MIYRFLSVTLILLLLLRFPSFTLSDESNTQYTSATPTPAITPEQESNVATDEANLESFVEINENSEFYNKNLFVNLNSPKDLIDIKKY